MKKPQFASLTIILGCAVLLGVGAPRACLGQPNPPIIAPPNSTPYGQSYGQWSTAWWQWLYSLSINTNQLSLSQNPLFLDGNVDLSLNQPEGPVWFLGGMCVLQTTVQGDFVGKATRTGTVPAGKALFFPILNCEWDNPTTPAPDGTLPGDYTTDELQAMAKTSMDPATDMVCEIDGVSVQSLTNSLTTPYRVVSPVFDYWLPAAVHPEQNFIQYSGIGISGWVSNAVADGVFLMLDPLPVGPHTIHFGGTIPGTHNFTLDVTYNLTVTDTPPPVAPPDSTPYGHSYADWSALWWQWLYQWPVSQNPMFMNGYVDLSLNQPDGPVWFLGGMMTTTEFNNNFYGEATRIGTVPAGKALFFPVLNDELDNQTYVPPANYTTAQLIANNKAIVDTAEDMVCEIDGMSVANLADPLTTPYRVVSPVFNYWLPATDNIQQYWGIDVSGLVTNAVSDGMFIMLNPLPVGPHTIHFAGTFPGTPSFTLDITYHLTVSDSPPPVAAPDSAPYGHSYAEWSAKHWQWLYSLSLNTNQLSLSQNPLFLDGNVDLSLNQPEGPVWFLGGMCVLQTTQQGDFVGKAARTGTVPAGKALFFPILDSEWDNPTTPAPDGTFPGDYSTDELRAMAKAGMDAATNMVCEIDGVSVQNLTNSLNTPYRVLSPVFDYWLPPAAPPELNFIQNSGINISGWVSNAVADGVFVMLDPLPAGPHTIHFGGTLAVTPSFTLDITYHLEVAPVLNLSLQPGNPLSLSVSWDVSVSGFVLESTSDLRSGLWAEVPGVQGNQAVIQLVPSSGTQQFYRLRRP